MNVDKFDIERIDKSLDEISKTLYELYYTNGHIGPEEYRKIERAFRLVQDIDLTKVKEMFETVEN